MDTGSLSANDSQAAAPDPRVNALGLGDLPLGPDVAPDTGWLGVRFDVQGGYPEPAQFTNVQTFLVVNGVLPAAMQGYRSPPKASFAKRPSAGYFTKRLQKRWLLTQQLRKKHR